MAYVADGPFGIYYYNITDPYNLAFDNAFDVFDNVTAIDIEGAKLYAVDESGGAIQTSFYVYDIVDIQTPVQIGTQGLDSQFYDIFVDGDIAYAADHEWMLPYNISDPTNPGYTTYTNNYTNGVWGFGPFALSTGAGVSLVDCTVMGATDPTIYHYPGATTGQQITIYGDYTYVANKSNLIIIRHFESLADTYVAGATTAQSLEVDTTSYEIYNATLTSEDYVPQGTILEYYLSADGGSHWEFVTPGLLHTFQYPGDDLRFLIAFLGPKDRSPQVYELTIDYIFNIPPDAPTLTDPTAVITTSSFDLVWTASVDDFSVDHYEIQMDDSGTFAAPAEYTSTGLTYEITGLTNGTYYFRVRAIDSHGASGSWSATVDAIISIPPTVPLPWWVYAIVGGGLLLVVVIIIIVVMVKKRKVAATR